jgi:hypothetical protein
VLFLAHCLTRAIGKNATYMTVADTHDQGMEVHANDREIVEAAVAQDGKLCAHNSSCGAICWRAFFTVTATSKSENGQQR